MPPLTADILQRAVGCSADLAARYCAPLEDACRFFEISTTARLAAFLAQIGHESGSFRYTSEVWGPTPAQARYEGRADLGNTQPGDGARFKGHGLIQITGRANHRTVTQGLRGRGVDCPDFEAEPDLLTEPGWAALSAAWYWANRGLNALADAGDLETITRRINGGLNGQADRLARWERAKSALAGMEDQPVLPILAAAAPTLVSSLAGLLIDGFGQATKDALGKATGHPEIVDPIMSTLVETAKTATGIEDPVDAVSAARKDQAIMRDIEQAANDRLQAALPLIDKLDAIEVKQRQDYEASMDAASERAKGEPNDQDPFLTRSIVVMMWSLLSGIGALIGLLSWLKVETAVIASVSGVFSTIAGAVVAKFSTRYDHRYGSSAGSAAKDVVVATLAGRRAP